MEATGVVSDVLLTLMANLRHCFLSPAASASTGSSSYAGVDTSTGQPFSGGSSRTVFASSLQIVLKGLIDYILKAGEIINKIIVLSFLFIKDATRDLVHVLSFQARLCVPNLLLSFLKRLDLLLYVMKFY